MFTLDISYDSDLSRINYRDWKDDLGDNLLDLFDSRGNCEYLVIGHLDKPYFTKTALTRMHKADLIELAEYYGYTHVGDYWLKSEIVVELQSLITVRHHYKIHYAETRWHDLDCDFTVRGYCKGEAVKVLILDGEYRWNTEKHLQNLFYRVPVSGTLSFPDGEYFIDEFMSDEYDYDPDDIVSNFKKHYTGRYKERIVKFLQNNLPARLDYM